MKNGTFIPVTRVQSSPDVKSDGKARFGDNNPTLTQQGIDVDKFISDNHVLALAKEGRISKDPETGRYRITNQTIEQKEPIMTTTVQAQKPEAKPEEPRTIIANALVGIFDAVSALQRTAFQANDKVVYGFATKLLTGELMDIKANYSKDAK